MRNNYILFLVIWFLLFILIGCAPSFHLGWNRFIPTETQPVESFFSDVKGIEIIYYFDGSKWVQVVYGMSLCKGKEYMIKVGGE